MNPLRTSILLALLTACSDAGVTKFNARPTAEITSHGSGDTVREGYPATLRGVVGDADDGTASLSVRWIVDGVGVCEDAVADSTGATSCEHDFAVGGGVVVLEVSDPQGGGARDQVELSVEATDAPTASIDSPAAGGGYYSDQLITFHGIVADGEDAPAELTVTWETEAGGDLGLTVDVASDGSVESHGLLPEGEHVVRLRAVDTSGKEGRDSVVVLVGPPNSAPTCSITAPDDGSAAQEGSEVRFEGEVADADVAANLLSATWSSNRDGDLGTSTPDTDGRVRFPIDSLSLGTHLVTLTVADEVGATCTTSVYFTVGNPPVLTLSTPADGDVVGEGEDIVFAGTVSDSEDPPTDVALSWVSDVDGEFSTAGADSSGAFAFRVDTLSAGDHTLTVTATDPDGLFAVTSLGLTVNALPTAPTVSLSPDPAGTADDLTASATGSVDPDASGTVTYAYAWYEDGVLSSASSSAVFPAASTTKHHTYRVVVTPSDGLGDGPAGEDSVTVANTAPVLSGPSLSDSTPSAGDTLTCSATASDADAADSPSITYAWSDGSTGAAILASGATGTTLTCTATADDGDGGTDTASATATITNGLPVVTGVSLSPATATTDSVLTVSATTSDPDGDPLTVTYDWTVNGTLVQSGSDPTLDGAVYFDKHDVVVCEVTADDGTDRTAVASSAVVVDNTPPGAPVLSISPASPTLGDDLTCLVDTGSSDDDADTITYTMAWTVDGVPYVAGGTTDTGGLDSGDPGWVGPSTTTWADDTVDGADVGLGEVWVCTATPDDGDDPGTDGTASVTTASATYSGTIEMPSAGTVDGFSHGEWAALNGGGRVAARLVLTQACADPIVYLYQHASADTSIQGSFYVMDSAGTTLASTSYATYSGCHDCWLGPSTRMSVTMNAGTTYYLGFSNGSGGDMSGPSIYLDTTPRTVGIATFDDPWADKPSSPSRGMPSTRVGWQNRWKIDCQ